VVAGQLLADPLDLVPVGQVGGDAVGRAVLGQCLDRVVDAVLVLADGGTDRATELMDRTSLAHYLCL
jgi:hypothetical protein